jgi:hypothetical protein
MVAPLAVPFGEETMSIREFSQEVYRYVYQFALKRDPDDPHTTAYGISMISLIVYGCAILVFAQVGFKVAFDHSLVRLLDGFETPLLVTFLIAVLGLPRVVFGSRSEREKLVQSCPQSTDTASIVRAVAFGCYPLLLLSLVLFAIH